jgi:dipeptidyl aminopeptidase/acylaminoacyl peptidase
MGGISDFVGYLGSTAPYRQRIRRAQYGDERDPEVRAFLRRISPLTAVERISRPMLIVHGQNDPYVPISEAEQMVFQLRSRGTEVWYLHADDEGDVFRKKHNRDAVWRTFAQFLSALP